MLFSGTFSFCQEIQPVQSGVPIAKREEKYISYLEPSVRLRRESGGQRYIFGSGTVVFADDKYAWIISCGHIFESKDDKIQVEVFYKEGKKLERPKLYNSLVLCVDIQNDISFVKIQPNYRMPCFSIAPVDYKINPKDKLESAGCDHAKEVATYTVVVYSVDKNYITTYINSPRPGRSGGGLIKDEMFVGICTHTSNFEQNGQFIPGYGWYVSLPRIHAFAKNNKLEFLLVDKPVLKIFDRSGRLLKESKNYIPVPI